VVVRQAERPAVKGHDASKKGHKYKPKSFSELECGPMPNVMADLSNIGGALCSTPQSFADAHY